MNIENRVRLIKKALDEYIEIIKYIEDHYGSPAFFEGDIQDNEMTRLIGKKDGLKLAREMFEWHDYDLETYEDEDK